MCPSKTAPDGPLRRVPSEILGRLDGDAPARSVIEEQDRLIAERAGSRVLYQWSKASADLAPDNKVGNATATPPSIRLKAGGADDTTVSSGGRLLRVADASVSPWSIKVNRIEIKDTVPLADLVKAMARQMKAEREKRQASPGPRGGGAP
jgi:hypothetical protein